MKMIPIGSITLSPNRQRSYHDINKHQELVASIHTGPVGLQNPIVVRISDGEYILVSGERRLRALSDIHTLGMKAYHNQELIPPGHIPVTEVGELDALSAWEAELDENLKRSDLTWQESAAAISSLYELRKLQAAEKGETVDKMEVAAELTTQSAPSLSQAFATLNNSTILSRHMDDMDVVKAKTASEAMKVIKRKERGRMNELLGKEVGKTFSSSLHKILCGDSLELMKEMLPSSFDVILTDPPYGMGADTFNTPSNIPSTHIYDDSFENFQTLMVKFSKESYRVAKGNAHLYLFCDIDNFSYLRTLFLGVGWKVHRTPLIWSKPNGSRIPWPDYGPFRRWEMIMYAVKGELKTQSLSSDVLTHPTEKNIGHTAQKPVPLFTELLSRSCFPGATVLDPFCGSGPIFPAAHSLSCIATGIEISEEYYGIAVSRIKTLGDV